MPDEAPEQTPAPAAPAFGQRRPVDKNGEVLRGFTKPEFHQSFWTPERRAEQSRKARQLIAEGRFGGQNGFHRRRSKKFQEIVAEHAQDRADEITARLDAMIDQTKDKRLQLEAIREFAKFESWAVQNSRDDEKELRKLSGNELERRLMEILGESLGIDFTAFLAAGKEAADAAEVIDSTAVEEGVAQIEAPYDPMSAEVGGDRLRAGAEMLEAQECEDCIAERERMAELLRASGVDDDDLVLGTVSLAHCEEHRHSPAGTLA